MYPQSRWILDLLPSNGKKALAVHGGVVALVVLPVVLMALWNSEPSLIIAFIIAVLIAYLLSSLIMLLNTYRQKEAIFLANAGDALIVIDRSWKIELWNKTAEILTGWNAEEVIGKSLREVIKFIREDDLTESMSFIEDAMVFGRVGTMEDHIVLMRKDGLQIPVGDSAAPLFDPSGAIIGAIIVFRDKSREHDLEKVREEFMTLASRELLAPLESSKASLQNMLAALTLTSVDIKAREYTEEIQRQNLRVYDLVCIMRDVLHAEQGKFPITPTPASAPDLADTAIEQYRDAAKQKAIVIHTSYQRDLPFVSVDTRLFEIVLRQLIDNSIKYTPQGGSVVVAIKHDARNMIVSVADTGYGIPQAQQAKVFSKLYRGDDAKNLHIDGVGLGLYLAKLLIERAGGRIWFESAEQKGSTFIFSFPLSGMARKEGLTNS